MGGIRCKVIIDYGNWRAEAAGLMQLAMKSQVRDIASELVAEAASNLEAATSGWTAALEAIEYDEANDGPKVLAQSKKVCDWGKALAGYRDHLTDTHIPYDEWIASMKAWRADDLAFYQAFAAEVGE